jgi:hypothetical protein
MKNNTDLSLFLLYLGNASRDKFTCPLCGARGMFVKDGSYTRGLTFLADGRVVSMEVTVPLALCTSCRHSHAILPPAVIPYSPFGFHFVISLLYDHITHKYPTVADLCETYDVSVSTLYRIYHRFLDDSRRMLGIMDSESAGAREALLAALNDNTSFLPGNDRLEDFYHATGSSFLQAKCRMRQNGRPG